VNPFKEKQFKIPTIHSTAKIQESSKSAYNGGFRGLKCSEFHASLRKQRGRKNNPMKTKLGTNIISFLYFKIV